MQELVFSGDHTSNIDDLVMTMMKQEIRHVLTTIISTANEYYQLNLSGLGERVAGEKLQSPSITQLYDILFYRLSAELILRDYSFFTGSHTNRRSEFFLYLSTIQLLSVKQ